MSPWGAGWSKSKDRIPMQGIYVHFMGWDEHNRRVYYVGQTVNYEGRYTKAQRASIVLEEWYPVTNRRKLAKAEEFVMRNIERKGGVLQNKMKHGRHSKVSGL
jgi:hypothetical protein